MTTRLFAFVTWGAVAASAVFWVLRLGVEAPRAPSFTTPVGVTAGVRGDWTRVLGAPPAAAPAAGEEVPAGEPALASRFRLVGVVALQAVHRRGASLGPRDGAAAVELELPALPPPATGTLPPVRAGAMPPPSPMPGMLARPPAMAAPSPPPDEEPRNEE